MSSYVGIDNVARKINKKYVGIDNVARTITKSYVGIDQVARLYFSSNNSLVVRTYGWSGVNINLLSWSYEINSSYGWYELSMSTGTGIDETDYARAGCCVDYGGYDLGGSTITFATQTGNMPSTSGWRDAMVQFLNSSGTSLSDNLLNYSDQGECTRTYTLPSGTYWIRFVIDSHKIYTTNRMFIKYLYLNGTKIL